MTGEPWLDPAAWQAAAEPRPGVDHVSVPVYDPQLGTIAVVRSPDGREAYGADSPSRHDGQ